MGQGIGREVESYIWFTSCGLLVGMFFLRRVVFTTINVRRIIKKCELRCVVGLVKGPKIPPQEMKYPLLEDVHAPNHVTIHSKQLIGGRSVVLSLALTDTITHVL